MNTKLSASDRTTLQLAALATAVICVMVLFATGQAGKGSGVEMSVIARHLVAGHGYLSPYLPPEYQMQTTVSPPLYVWLIAGIYALAGVETFAARLILQLINIAIHCATLVILYHYSRKAISSTTAKAFAILFCIHPHLIYLPSNIWETSLTTFFLSCILYLATFRLTSFNSVSLLAFGLLLGTTSLSNPAWTIAYPFICVLPFLLSQTRFNWRQVVPRIALISLAFAVVVTPWIYRNYIVTHEFVFIRGMTGPEWLKGNNPHANGGHGDGFVRYYLPSSEEERQKLAAMGESAYDAMTRTIALDYIRNNPAEFASLTLRRVLMWWSGDLDATRWYYDQRTTDRFKKSGAAHHFLLCLLLVISGTLTTIMAIIGLFNSNIARRSMWGILLYLIVLPIPFYLIIGGFRYQSALMPMLLVPAAHAVAALAMKWKLIRSNLPLQPASP